jgi:hypothetical protein
MESLREIEEVLPCQSNANVAGEQIFFEHLIAHLVRYELTLQSPYDMLPKSRTQL